MRATSLTVLLGTFFVVAGGCCSPPPRPAATTALPPSASFEPPPTRDAVPRVVRRILAEERELVRRSLALATALPDPRGKERALAEVRDLERELAELEEPLTDGRSETIDAVVAKLLLVDTRVALLHERLRGATDHTTAVMLGPE